MKTHPPTIVMYDTTTLNKSLNPQETHSGFEFFLWHWDAHFSKILNWNCHFCHLWECFGERFCSLASFQSYSLQDVCFGVIYQGSCTEKWCKSLCDNYLSFCAIPLSFTSLLKFGFDYEICLSWWWETFKLLFRSTSDLIGSKLPYMDLERLSDYRRGILLGATLGRDK